MRKLLLSRNLLKHSTFKLHSNYSTVLQPKLRPKEVPVWTEDLLQCRNIKDFEECFLQIPFEFRDEVIFNFADQFIKPRSVNKLRQLFEMLPPSHMKATVGMPLLQKYTDTMGIKQARFFFDSIPRSLRHSQLVCFMIQQYIKYGYMTDAVSIYNSEPAQFFPEYRAVQIMNSFCDQNRMDLAEMVLKSRENCKSTGELHWAMIAQCARLKMFDKAEEYFDRLPQHLKRNDEMVRLFSENGAMDRAKKYFDMIPSGLVSRTCIAKMIEGYFNVGDVDHALEMMPKESSHLSAETVELAIKTLLQHGREEEAEKLFCTTRWQLLSGGTTLTMMNYYASRGDIEKAIDACFRCGSSSRTAELCQRVISLVLKTGNHYRAMRVLETLKPEQITKEMYREVIASLVAAGHRKLAQKLLKTMPPSMQDESFCLSIGIKPEIATTRNPQQLCLTIEKHIRNGNMQEAESAYKSVPVEFFSEDLAIQIMKEFCDANRVDLAEMVLKSRESCESKGGLHWAMIAQYARLKMFDKAEEHFDSLPQQLKRNDEMVRLLGENGAVDRAKKYLDMITGSDRQPTAQMIEGYFNVGDVDHALEVMPKEGSHLSAETVELAIKKLLQHGRIEEAEELFNDVPAYRITEGTLLAMVNWYHSKDQRGVLKDIFRKCFTLLRNSPALRQAMITSCLNAGNFHLAKATIRRMHRELRSKELYRIIFDASIADRPEFAVRLFCSMPETMRDESFVKALVETGSVLNIYETLKTKNVYITPKMYLVMLEACSQFGQTKVAELLFNEMEQAGITPDIEHWNARVLCYSEQEMQTYKQEPGATGIPDAPLDHHVSDEELLGLETIGTLNSRIEDKKRIRAMMSRLNTVMHEL